MEVHMKTQKNIKMCFTFPEKIYRMVEKMAEDNLTTMTGIIKTLIIDAYNRSYDKEENRKCR